MQRVGEIQLTEPRPAQIAMPPPPEKHLQKCLASMVRLAEARRESVSKEGLKVYATVLAQHDSVHVDTVINRLCRTPRKEYEKAIPELGELEAMVKAEEKASRPPFVSCGSCNNGIVLVNKAGQPWKFSIDGHEKFAKECDCKKSWRQQ